jgi:hypothetical protein
MKTASKKQIGLECGIADVVDMAGVCEMLMELLRDNERSAAELNITAKQAAEHLAYWRDAVSFAILHLKTMTKDLQKKYYAETAKD